MIFNNLLTNFTCNGGERDLTIVFSAIVSTLVINGNNGSYLPGVWHFASKKKICLEANKRSEGRFTVSLPSIDNSGLCAVTIVNLGAP